jgi:hypothetical protein
MYQPVGRDLHGPELFASALAAKFGINTAQATGPFRGAAIEPQSLVSLEVTVPKNGSLYLILD